MLIFGGGWLHAEGATRTSTLVLQRAMSTSGSTISGSTPLATPSKGLTLVHLSAQLEPCLVTRKRPTHP